MPNTSNCVINCLELPSKCRLTGDAIATMSVCPKNLKKTNPTKDPNKGSLADHPYLKYNKDRRHRNRGMKIYRGF